MGSLLGMLLALFLVSAVIAWSEFDRKKAECEQDGGDFAYEVVLDIPIIQIRDTTCTMPDGEITTDTVALLPASDPLPGESEEAPGGT